MAKAGRQTTKKRARRPRCEALDKVLPKDKADALRRWLADEKATLAAAREKAEQLDAGKREIDRHLAISTNQMRPPWMDASLLRPSRKRRRGKKIGRPPDYAYDKIAARIEDYIRAQGLPDKASWLIEKAKDLCAVAPRIQTPGETQFKQFVGTIHRRHKRRLARGRKVGK